jgi:hypothetical protein
LLWLLSRSYFSGTKGDSEMRLPHLTFTLILVFCGTTLADDSIGTLVKASKAPVCLRASKECVRIISPQDDLNFDANNAAPDWLIVTCKEFDLIFSEHESSMWQCKGVDVAVTPNASIRADRLSYRNGLVVFDANDGKVVVTTRILDGPRTVITANRVSIDLLKQQLSVDEGGRSETVP